MALGKGIPVINGFDLNSKLPLDSRTVVDTTEEMNALVTNGSVGDGQLCYCKADKKLYVLKDNAWSEVGGSGGGGKSVPPTLNLIDFETGEVRTTITEEEYNNLKNGLYNSVNYYIETYEEAYLQSKLLSIYDDKYKSLSCNFSSIKINATSATDISSTNIIYDLTIGQKDTNGNYPITIEKLLEVPFGSNSGGSGASLNIVTIDNFDNGDHNQQGFVMPTEDVVLFTDKALVSLIGCKNVQNGVISYICFQWVVSAQDDHYKYAGTLYEITAITGGYHIEKTETGISPEFLPNYSGNDNGKVLSVVNGKTQWTTPTDSLTFPTTSPTSQLIPSITTSNTQQNLTIGNGLEIKDGALQTTGGGGSGSGSNVEIFQPTITNVSVNTYDEEKEISISFDALNGVKPYIQSLVDGNKNFSANLFLKTIISNNYQIRLISPLSLINTTSGDTIFSMCGRLIQSTTSKIDFKLTFNTTGPVLTFYFDNNDVYTRFKQLASLLFTTDTILKLTIKTDE